MTGTIKDPPPDYANHAMVILFGEFLRAVVIDQDTGDSYVAEAMRHEYGESCTHMVLVAADRQRLKMKHQEKVNKPEGETGEDG